MADSPSWHEQQEASVARYLSPDYNRDETVPRRFAGFMAVNLDRDAAVLDIGCGISPDLPPYVRELGLRNYTGLEPLDPKEPRRFHCLKGVAEDIPLPDNSVDAVIFATSQDHIPEIDEAMRQVRRVLRPGGRVYMWIGRYEPEMIADAKTLGNVLRAKGWRKWVRLALPQIEYGLALWQMRDRRRRLENSVPIDTHHCRWYTMQRIEASLRRWDMVMTRPPLAGSPTSVFIEAAFASA